MTASLDILSSPTRDAFGDGLATGDMLDMLQHVSCSGRMSPVEEGSRSRISSEGSQKQGNAETKLSQSQSDLI
jgi:hypothetical protein